ncbi:MAG: hypothetical protein H8D97_00385 [Proteobacteria bacterium]|nr:hypothetical protein [Pseudomonadota bacterium]
MLKRLIIRIRNSGFIQWLKDIKLSNFNIFGIFTIYKRILFIIARSHHKACYGETKTIVVLYQIIGAFTVIGLLATPTEATFLLWVGKVLLSYGIWFYLPFVWLEYENEYNKSTNESYQ